MHCYFHAPVSVSRLYDPPGEGEVTDAACRLADTALLCYRASDVASLQQAVTKVGVATIITCYLLCCSISPCCVDTTPLSPWCWSAVRETTR